MTKPFLTLMAVSASLLSLGACTTTSNPTSLPPGEYKTNSTSTSSDGTNYSTEKTTNVQVDKYGNKKATVKTETTTDPEGLLNKRTSTSTKTYHD